MKLRNLGNVIKNYVRVNTCSGFLHYCKIDLENRFILKRCVVHAVNVTYLVEKWHFLNKIYLKERSKLIVPLRVPSKNDIKSWSPCYLIYWFISKHSQMYATINFGFSSTWKFWLIFFSFSYCLCRNLVYFRFTHRTSLFPWDLVVELLCRWCIFIVILQIF